MPMPHWSLLVLGYPGDKLFEIVILVVIEVLSKLTLIRAFFGVIFVLAEAAADFIRRFTHENEVAFFYSELRRRRWSYENSTSYRDRLIGLWVCNLGALADQMASWSAVSAWRCALFSGGLWGTQISPRPTCKQGPNSISMRGLVL